MPTFPFVMFGVAGLLASIGDVRVLRSGVRTGAFRIARHLWRMSFALFVAAISFFIGQSQVFPKPIRILPVLALPVLAGARHDVLLAVAHPHQTEPAGHRCGHAHSGAHMTRTTNARIAGVTYLLYIAVGLTSLFLGRSATSGEGTAAKLASIAQHAPQTRITMILGLSTCFMAMLLAVALYGITRDEDHEVAVFGMACRLAEGVLGVVSTVATLGLLWLATCFAVGSTVFSWLFLRGRMIPVSLAWLGVVASVLLVVCLPLQIAGFLGGPITQLMWLPMLAFEVPLGLWLIVKGVRID
jgi:hypothetical protein